MLYGEIITVFFPKIHKMHINPHRGQKVTYFYIKPYDTNSYNWSLKGLLNLSDSSVNGTTYKFISETNIRHAFSVNI